MMKPNTMNRKRNLTLRTIISSMVHNKKKKTSTTTNNTPPTKTSTNTSKKTVSFGTIETRIYEVTIGDHPCCREGCALTLDWEYRVEGAPLSVEEYEAQRPTSNTSDFKCRRTTWEERRQVLTENNKLSDLEVRKALRRSYRERTSFQKNTICGSQAAAAVRDGFFGDGSSTARSRRRTRNATTNLVAEANISNNPIAVE